MSIDDGDNSSFFHPAWLVRQYCVIFHTKKKLTFCFPPLTYRFVSVDCVYIIQNDESVSIQYFTHRFSHSASRHQGKNCISTVSMKYSIQFLSARRSHIARVVVVVSSIEHEEFINSLSL